LRPSSRQQSRNKGLQAAGLWLSALLKALSAVEVAPQSHSGSSSPRRSAGLQLNAKMSTNYTWEQNEEEVTVEVPLPKGVDGRDVKVKIGKEELKLLIASQGAVFDGLLAGKVNVGDSNWVVETLIGRTSPSA